MPSPTQRVTWSWQLPCRHSQTSKCSPSLKLSWETTLSFNFRTSLSKIASKYWIPFGYFLKSKTQFIECITHPMPKAHLEWRFYMHTSHFKEQLWVKGVLVSVTDLCLSVCEHALQATPWLPALCAHTPTCPRPPSLTACLCLSILGYTH